MIINKLDKKKKDKTYKKIQFNLNNHENTTLKIQQIIKSPKN